MSSRPASDPMIRESGIVFNELEPESVDMPFGTMSGAGVIFGVTGGVTEAVLRKIAQDNSRGNSAGDQLPTACAVWRMSKKR